MFQSEKIWSRHNRKVADRVGRRAKRVKQTKQEKSDDLIKMRNKRANDQ